MPTKDKVQVRKKIKLRKPPIYCIIFYNNDKTPVNLVIYLLIMVFKYSQQQAEEITLKIHNSKSAPVFINSKEVCELKIELLKKVCEYLGEKNLQYELKVYEENND